MVRPLPAIHRVARTGSVGGMPTLASIDCGTNSTRLLISRDGETIDRRMVITRLGKGVDATGKLDPEAIERTLAVLREYKAAMDEHGVERVRIAATSAARDASNSEDFFGPAEEIVGTRPELLSGDEEGRMSFAGATADLDPSRGPVPRDRHRRRVDRVHGRHRAARRGPQLRHRVRAAHREAPDQRPAGGRRS